MEHLSNTANIVISTVTLLLIAAATLGFTKRVRLPFTVILVLVGMALVSLVRALPDYFGILGMLEISHDLIFFIFLPTLIFESTFNMDVQHLRRNMGPVLMLAIPGLLLSTAIIGGVVSLLTDLPLTVALLLGAILSATDPVAVIALFKQLGAPKRLAVLVEGESLLNDATSIVLAKILIGVLAAGSFSAKIAGSGFVDFFVLFFGGLVVGILLGWLAGLLLGMVETDALIEISITTALAYLSFLLAEKVLHVSGVMATVGAGLTVGGWGRIKISPPVRVYLEHFWEYMAFLANAFIFLLVGMKVSLPDLWQSLDVLAVVIVAMLLGRAAVVYGLVPVLNRLPGADPINRKYQTVMLWGGLRGAIALAIVLSLDNFAYSSLFTAIVIGAVLFTLLVQGLTMARLMQWLGLDRPPLMDVVARLEYRLSAHRQALDLIPQLQRGGQFSAAIADHVRRDVSKELSAAQQEMATLRQQEVGLEQEQALLFLRAFAEERACFAELFAHGHISEQAYRQLLLTLSTQTDALRQKGRYVSIQTHRWRRKIEPHLYAFLDRHPWLASLGERWRMRRLAINFENDWAHYQSTNQVLARLRELAELESIAPEVVGQVEGHYREWQARSRRQLDMAALQFPEFVTIMQERLARRMVLVAAMAVADNYAERGILTRTTAEQVDDELRQQLATLRGPLVRHLRYGAYEWLRASPLFRALPDEVVARLSGELQTRNFEAGEIICHAHSLGQDLYLVARGVLRSTERKNGEALDVATMIPGDHFGASGVLRESLPPVDVIGVTAGTLYILEGASLAKLAGDYPDIGRAQ